MKGIVTRAKLGIKTFKYGKGMWKIGIEVIHHFEETYIQIKLYRWNISIGKMYFLNWIEFKAGEE